MTTCTQFRDLLCDLATDRLMEAASRDRALAHAAECAACASQLDAQRALSHSLGQLADETAKAVAPERLKTSLMAEFARQQAAQSHATPPVAPFASNRPTHRGAWWMGAIAAGLALVAIPAGVLMMRAAAPESARGATPMRAPLAPVEPKMEAPTPVAPMVADNSQPKGHRAPSSMRKRSNTAAAQRDDLAAVESTTDFIPLTYMRDEVSLSSGHVIRVEVPRSTLISMGLPVNADRSEDLVKADVVLGDDGVARAIRFVN